MFMWYFGVVEKARILRALRPAVPSSLGVFCYLCGPLNAQSGLLKLRRRSLWFQSRPTKNSRGRLDSPAVASRVSRARCGQAFAPTPTPSRGGCQTCTEHSHVFRGFRGETELTPDEHTPGRHGLARQSQLGSGEPRRLRRASAARGSRSTGRSPRLLLRRDTVSARKRSIDPNNLRGG